MKISILKAEYRTFDVYLDDSKWRSIHQDIFGMRPQLPPDVSAVTDLEEQFYALEYKGSKRYALKQLAMRNFSSFEMLGRLEERLVSRDVAQQVLEECQQLGYINDEEWIGSFLKGRLTTSYGPHRLAAKLRKKGVPLEKINEILAPIKDLDSQKEAIIALLQKNYRAFDLKDQKQKAKVIQSLQRRGFEIGSILQTLDCRLI